MNLSEMSRIGDESNGQPDSVLESNRQFSRRIRKINSIGETPGLIKMNTLNSQGHNHRVDLPKLMVSRASNQKLE